MLYRGGGWYKDMESSKRVPPTIPSEFNFVRKNNTRNLHIINISTMKNGPPSFLQAKKRDRQCNTFTHRQPASIRVQKQSVILYKMTEEAENLDRTKVYA